MHQPTTSGIDQSSELTLFRFNGTTQLVEVPYSEIAVSCGVADLEAAATDYMERRFDLNYFYGTRPTTTYFAHASGSSLADADIQEGDLIIFDTSTPWGEGDTVICQLNGALVAKRVERRHDGRYFLVSSQPGFKPIELKDDAMFVFGPMTGLSRRKRPVRTGS